MNEPRKPEFWDDSSVRRVYPRERVRLMERHVVFSGDASALQV